MISNFASRKFEWLDKVCNDRVLTPLAFRVAYKISTFVNKQTGYAHPSHDRLAFALAVSRKSIQRSIAQLAERGHLEIEVGKTEGTANRYRLTQASWPADHFQAETGTGMTQGGASSVSRDGRLDRDRNDAGGASSVSRDGRLDRDRNDAGGASSVSRRVRHQCPPNPFREPVYRTLARERDDAIESTGDGSALQGRVSPTMAVSR